jgi:hypothetical protein
MPPPRWLIGGLFEADSLVMLAGPSYSFKSFLLIDWLMCMASGRRWQGRETAVCRVGYALGEGKAGLMKRIQAWITFNNPSDEELARLKENFKITFSVPQMASKASVDNMLADLEAEEFKPDVIAIDTFNRSMVGFDENDAKDAGLWVEQADRLRQSNYTVVLLHHTKKNTEFGVTYRGSTAIIGAMDTAMTLVRDGDYTTLTVTKQKDHDEGAPMRFKRTLVGLGDEESCVLTYAPTFDSRFIVEAPRPSPGPPPDIAEINEVIDDLIEDYSFDSDRARARELARRLPALTETAAQTRVSRRVRERMSPTVL